MVLEPSEMRAFYDRFGKKQDTQAFYEEPALKNLVDHAHFDAAKKVFEFGCGTGRFAGRLLAQHLPVPATYLGCDLSPTMVKLAEQRLTTHAERAQVVQSDGTVRFPLPDNSVDRVISTYVLDLLSEANIGQFFYEAHRVLNPGGKLCLVSLTDGVTFISRIVTYVWASVFRLRATLVGGCRPIHLEQYIAPDYWQPEYRNVVIAFGIPSEVVVLHVKDSTQRA